MTKDDEGVGTRLAATNNNTSATIFPEGVKVESAAKLPTGVVEGNGSEISREESLVAEVAEGNGGVTSKEEPLVAKVAEGKGGAISKEEPLVVEVTKGRSLATHPFWALLRQAGYSDW